MKLLQKYPELKFFYSKNWEYSKSLASFYSAKTIFDEDIILSYTDVVYKKNILEKLAGVNSKIAIIIDSNWKNRYEGRSSDFLIEAEKFFNPQVPKVSELVRVI